MVPINSGYSDLVVGYNVSGGLPCLTRQVGSNVDDVMECVRLKNEDLSSKFVPIT